MVYNRQRFLITFLEIFGGELSRTNCQKLVFLYCQYYNKQYYDFFPYKFGPFSYVLFDDLRFLIKKGLLHDSEHFSITKSSKPIYDAFDITEKFTLSQFKERLEGIRGQELIQKTYNEFPYYAQNSELEHDLLLFQSEDINNRNEFLYSLGYEGISIDKFLNILITNRIEFLFDVRNNPISRKYGFTKSKLLKYLKSLSINYIHLPNLGIPPLNRRDISSNEKRCQLFDYYEKNILDSAVEDVNLIVKTVKEKHRSCLMCFEKNYHSCHRSRISRKIMKEKSIATIHL